MKIFEITDKNLEWSILSGVETEFELESEVELSYSRAISLLEMLIKLKSTHRVTTWLPTVLTFEDKLIKFVNFPFPDEDDADLDVRRNRARTMLSEISSLKQRLPK